MRRQFQSYKFFGILFFVLFAGLHIKAQDKITMANGTEVNAKVLEISDKEIKYKAFDQLDGPTRVLPISEVFMIKFENGHREVFNQGKTNPGATTNQPAVVRSGVSAAPVDTGYTKPKSPKFGGPRIGITYISPGILADDLAERGKNPTISQFGWQFEVRMFSIENGPSGIFEFVPLIGGMEQGLFLPSANFLVGIRGAGDQSPEFGIGPNISVAGIGIVIAAGINFRTSNINFPVNIAFVPSTNKKVHDSATNTEVTKGTGQRWSMTVGFNMRKK